MQLKVPIRLTWITRVNSSSSAGPDLPSVFAGRADPAQLTSTFNPPQCAAAASSAAVHGLGAGDVGGREGRGRSEALGDVLAGRGGSIEQRDAGAGGDQSGGGGAAETGGAAGDDGLDGTELHADPPDRRILADAVLDCGHSLREAARRGSMRPGDQSARSALSLDGEDSRRLLGVACRHAARPALKALSRR